MKKPIIGILGAHMSNNGGPAPVPADYVNHAYCAGVENAGGIPILLPVLKDPADMDPVLEEEIRVEVEEEMKVRFDEAGQEDTQEDT